MASGITELEAIQTFSSTLLLECRKSVNGLEVWNALGTMRYQLGAIGTFGDEVVYRPSRAGIYRPPEYLPELATEVAKRAGLRIVY